VVRTFAKGRRVSRMLHASTLEYFCGAGDASPLFEIVSRQRVRTSWAEGTLRDFEGFLAFLSRVSAAQMHGLFRKEPIEKISQDCMVFYCLQWKA
jgi:hypothetical protein